MSGRGILDADMATLGGWAVQGWRWWVDELTAMVPPRWRNAGRESLPRYGLRDGGLVAEGNLARAGDRIVVAVPRDLCLVREVQLPAVGGRDLQRLLTLERDMLMPLAPGALVIAGRRLGAAEAGRVQVAVAGLPRERAEEAIAAAARQQLTVARIVLDEPPIDFTPALREAGLLVPRPSATPLLWALVAFLALLNVGVATWRDAAEVARLEQVVADQQPAVNVAQTIRKRIRADRQLAVRTIVLRRRHDALGDVARIGAVLPAGAWLQRYAWDGATVRIAGSAPPKTDIASILRRSGGYADVRSDASEAREESPVGTPFDVTARIGHR